MHNVTLQLLNKIENLEARIEGLEASTGSTVIVEDSGLPYPRLTAAAAMPQLTMAHETSGSGVVAPAPCSHHIRGRMADDSVTCSATNQCRSSEELANLFNHLNATLFHGNLTGLDELWWRVEKEFRDDRIEVHFCTTPANRCVLFRCKSCRQQVCAPHGRWVDPQKYSGLRRNLLTWFCNPHVVDIGAIDTASREL